MDQEILKELETLLKKNCLILGVGNPLRGDDGFGSLLAKAIRGKINREVIDAESSPENFLGKIIDKKPEVLLVVDTAEFFGKRGALKLFKKEEILKTNFVSTHNISLKLLFEFLKKNSQRDIDIVLLAVQPESLKLGNPLSAPLQRTFDVTKEEFIKIAK